MPTFHQISIWILWRSHSNMYMLNFCLSLNLLLYISHESQKIGKVFDLNVKAHHWPIHFNIKCVNKRENATKTTNQQKQLTCCAFLFVAPTFRSHFPQFSHLLIISMGAIAMLISHLNKNRAYEPMFFWSYSRPHTHTHTHICDTKNYHVTWIFLGFGEFRIELESMNVNDNCAFKTNTF